MKPDSELCLKVVAHLAEIGGHDSIVDFWCPDDLERTKGALPGEKFIDLVAVAADGVEFALEHTTVESYAQQLHDARQIESLLSPLETKLVGKLPGDRTYLLCIGMGAVADKSLIPAEVQSSLEHWIVASAPELPAGSPQVAPRHQLRGMPPDVAVDVVLSAWPPSGPSGPGGTLRIGRFVHNDPEVMMAMRVHRIRVAFETKLPKLLAKKPARTVLVLEDEDLAMSNVSDVWTALRGAADGLHLCDTIVVVETSTQPYIATVVYNEGQWLADFSANRFGLPEAPPAST